MFNELFSLNLMEYKIVSDTHTFHQVSRLQTEESEAMLEKI